MTTRFGINGFGRMGRLALRAAWGWPELELACINELTGGGEVGAVGDVGSDDGQPLRRKGALAYLLAAPALEEVDHPASV